MTENEFLLQDRLGAIRDTITKYGEENFYISYSGGKDSTVIHHLVDMALPDNKIPRVFCNTGIEYNAIVEFVRGKMQQDDRFVMIQPQKNIKKTLEEKGYPFKSKLFSEMHHTFRSHKEEVWAVMDQIDKNPELRYDYDFINNIPKNTRYVIKEIYGMRTTKDGRVYSWQSECPQILWHMVADKNATEYNISDKCCLEMKEKPLDNWQKENNRPHKIVGLMREEGGRRARAKCKAFRNGKLSFNPLVAVTHEWEKWFIKEYSIPLCKLYYEPYNFDRVGCKGCPLNQNIQRELTTLEKYFPNERKQCEYIWRPVYEEYRRIGYRLNNDEQLKLL